MIAASATAMPATSTMKFKWPSHSMIAKKMINLMISFLISVFVFRRASVFQ